MLNESLKTILGDELFNQISTKLEGMDATAKEKVNIANIGDGSYMPRSKYNEVANKVTELEGQIASRDDQLKDLAKNNKGNEEFLKQIKELQDTNNTIKSDYEAKISKMTTDHAIERAISGAKAKNVKAVMGLVDLTKVTYKDDKLIGLDEQLEALRKTDSYLFEEAKTHNSGFNPGKQQEAPNNNAVMNDLIRGNF